MDKTTDSFTQQSHTSPAENFDKVVRLTARDLLYTVVITAARIFKPILFTYRQNENICEPETNACVVRTWNNIIHVMWVSSAIKLYADWLVV